MISEENIVSLIMESDNPSALILRSVVE